eukprot:CAMPEP_0177660928 /NCGR_PEP_ID=MMETSP0447-20121125/18348_1 /TAXON_ID=0 /ORGANISM="Stygamoeba regulata, Strain BSH-02190019" /LENGTH=120 /DNA_ID=CAMNT_0019166119 /DNA_START=315 /DNA_END=677 /DNA_ORIENTATION=-
MSRPFGVALLLGGVDKTGAHLFHCDPSGTFIEYKAKAIGAGSEGAQTTLEEEWNSSMTLVEAERLAISVLKQVMEEKITSVNVEVSIVPTTTAQYILRTETEIDALLQDVGTNTPAHAQA